VADKNPLPHYFAHKPSFLMAYAARFRWKSFLIQLLCLIIVLIGLRYFYANTVENLRRQHIASGFGFLDSRAGIPIPESLIPYGNDSTYGGALLAGLVNTIFMSAICIFASTILGFAIAFGRLSKNWLLSKLCFIYVEIFRNIPVLLVILFFYFGVLQQYLPNVKNSIALPFDIYINRRGAYFPAFEWHGGLWGNNILLCLLFALAALCFLARHYLPQSAGGFKRKAICWAGVIGLILGIGFLAHGFAISRPYMGRFNIMGGHSISPEFLALFIGLSVYTAALIAETVRAGIEGVDKGYKDAGASLGFTEGMISRFITVPLALRIIVPPLSSQYMNAAKNTSLAVAIGYTDLMSVGNSVLIQTNQSVEVVCIWIIAYLGLCLIISALMNLLNYRLLRGERR